MINNIVPAIRISAISYGSEDRLFSETLIVPECKLGGLQVDKIYDFEKEVHKDTLNV